MATEDKIHYGQDYHSTEIFNAKTYLEDIYPGCGAEGIVPVVNSRVMQCLHNAMNSGLCKGKTFVDICAGPSIHAAISASQCFKNIYLTEYAPQNLEELQKWVKKAPDAHDWTSFLQHVADLEGTTCAAVEDRVRTSIRGFLPCDLSQEEPLDPSWVWQHAPFDCIYSGLTIEAVAKDQNDYLRILTKLASFLRPGGALLLFGVSGQTFYSTGGHKFYSMPLDEKFLRNALRKAGFKLIEYIPYGFDSSLLERKVSANAQTYFFLFATKK